MTINNVAIDRTLPSRSLSKDWRDNWDEKARRNIEKWGNQGPLVLVSVLTEEVGEVARAVTEEHYLGGGRLNRIEEEIDDLAAVCIQMLHTISLMREGKDIGIP